VSKFLEIKNQTDSSAEMYLSGTVQDDTNKNYFWDDPEGYVFPADVKAQLDSLKGKDLTVYINSDGGNVFAGIAIANMLKRHDGQTTAIVDGLAASIATQAFFACDVKKMPKNTYLMIHKPWSSVCGDANGMNRAAEMLNTVQRGLESMYLDNAKDGVTAEQISTMTNAETWLTGEEAAEIFKIEVLDPVDMVACACNMPQLFKNPPANIKFLTENKAAASKEPPRDPPRPPKAEDGEQAKKEKVILQKRKILIMSALAKGSEFL